MLFMKATIGVQINAFTGRPCGSDPVGRYTGMLITVLAIYLCTSCMVLSWRWMQRGDRIDAAPAYGHHASACRAKTAVTDSRLMLILYLVE
jgi:hypothetical protein